MRNAEVIRQWQILKAVESARVGVTIHDLANETGVTTRTIRRDLTALQEAGFALFDEGEGNDTKRWKLDTAPFRAVQDGLSVADVAALYLSRSIVVALSGWPLVDELGSALAKLDRALNPKMREFLSTLPQVVSTKAGPRAGAASIDHLAPLTRRLFDAVRDRHVIEMAYFSARSNRAKSYTVEPYRLALAHGGVYLVAWVPLYNEFRTFAVERIQKLSVSEATFRKTRELPADLFASSMGVFWGEPERVVIEFAARLAPYVQGRLWHPSQQLEVLPDGRIRLTLDVSHDWALQSWILSFGSGVKIVEPRALADAIRKEHKAALSDITM
ncbi:MAG: WYL domain-containing protein [Acidobacteria bacterium]|jgi:predicted DNA-binding transcriptional regulator YafY|nr:WYL domain-containing protein [Acidobacteriota bacterium]